MTNLNQTLPSIPYSPVKKWVLLSAGIMATVYFTILTFFLPKGHPVLFFLLVAGEIFHLWQIWGYIHTVWKNDQVKETTSAEFYPPVDVFITVAGEPVDVVEQTALAALAMDYPKFNVHILNDGYVAKKENWSEIINLAKSLGISCITRKVAGGAKAGNINNALKITQNEFVAVFDADQVPHKDFLKKMTGFLADKKVAFVQSPQYYKNQSLNDVTTGSWQQQELFFGPICRGKDHWNSTFMCGTNMVIRKSALFEVGGMSEDNIAEDFLTSLFLHEKGWKSVYVPEVLVQGLAPEDLYSYYKQQLRWARGSLEVMFRHNPLFNRGLNIHQKMEYLSSASYYLSGSIVLMNALLPLIFLFTGLAPLATSTMVLGLIFLPYIFLVVLILRMSSDYTYTFKALSFSMSSFHLQLQALAAVLTGAKTKFAVTSKQKLSGSFAYLSWPHMGYIALAIIGLEVGLLREGLSAQILTNISWVLFNTIVFMPFIAASLPKFWQKKEKKLAETASLITD